MNHDQPSDSGGSPDRHRHHDLIKGRRHLDGIGGCRDEPRRGGALVRFDLRRARVRRGRHGRTRFLTLVVGASLALLLSGAPDAASAEDSAGRIVFESDPRGHRDIWIMDADGSQVEALTDDSADDVFPVWSPDGGRIAWSRGVKGVYEIWVMNADGSGKTQITFEGVRSRVPTWSPNGDRIAFGRSGDLWVMDADGSDQQQLTSGPNLDLGPRWSPVEDRIAFFSDRNGGSAVYTVRSDGTQIAQMTPDALNAGAPGWSPDGNQLSFSDNFCAACAAESDLFVMDVDGSNLRQLTDTDPANEGGAGWSPDGTHIVTDVPTLYGNHLRKADIAVINVDGGDVVYLTRTLGIDEQHPDWSPA